MAICSVQFKGQALGRWNGMEVILPDSGDGPFPVLYLLHGLSDSEVIWSRHVPINDVMAGRELILVMPDGGAEFYVNNPCPGGGQFEDHVVEDVVGFVDRTFPTLAERRGRALAGNSMGGYGATMLALRHPEMFSAAVGLSAACYFAHADRPIPHEYADSLTRALPAGEYDLFALAERSVGAAAALPALRLDCGVDDHLIESNRDFHAHLEKLGIPHEYEEHPGEHTWQYWRDRFDATIEFVLRHMG